MSKFELSKPELSKIGRRIKEIRLKTDGAPSQSDFLRDFLGLAQGKTVGAAQKEMSRLESGLEEPSLPFLLAISKKCGVSIDYILTGTRPEAQPKAPSLSDALEILTFLIHFDVFKVEDSGSKLSLVLEPGDEDLKTASNLGVAEFENQDLLNKYLFAFSRLYYFDILKQYAELLSVSKKYPVTEESLLAWLSQLLGRTKGFDPLCKETSGASFEHRQNLNPTLARLAVYGSEQFEKPSKMTFKDFLQKYQSVTSL